MQYLQFSVVIWYCKYKILFKALPISMRWVPFARREKDDTWSFLGSKTKL